VLGDEAFVSLPRSPRGSTSALKLVTVGSLEQLYKAPDVLIDAVAECLREGMDIELAIIGDGKHRTELETHAKAVGLARHVRFLGQLTAGNAVRAQLDRADLFVLPSRTEGLPRAMVEAMARGLPCVGSTMGGIPELLAPEDMVPPGDVAALAQKIREVVSDTGRMARMSTRNLEKAREYREEILRERRVSFYEQLKEETLVWLKTRR
jgi:glycosyltransferase involved in cell wall biosynthesis